MPIKAKKTLHRINSYKRKLSPQSIERATVKATEYLRGEIVLVTPVDTGSLRNSFYIEVQTAKSGTKAILKTNNPYASFVEFGTGIKGQQTNSNPNATFNYRQTKWVYFNVRLRRLMITDGQQAVGFMWKTANRRRNKLIRIIRNDIKKG